VTSDEGKADTMLRHMVKVMSVLERSVMKERMVLETIDGADETIDGRRGRHYCEARDDGEADAG
jgi:hypothetical protein